MKISTIKKPQDWPQNNREAHLTNILLHGIITRDVTATDCLKLFLIIRSFSYLERLFIVAEKLIKYNSLTLHTEDRLLFGDEEYEKIIAELLQ